eukprot:scaffold5078_cov63-Phaeocystis_antarctica.AAC.14
MSLAKANSRDTTHETTRVSKTVFKSRSFAPNPKKPPSLSLIPPHLCTLNTMHRTRVPGAVCACACSINHSISSLRMCSRRSALSCVSTAQLLRLSADARAALGAAAQPRQLRSRRPACAARTAAGSAGARRRRWPGWG